MLLTPFRDIHDLDLNRAFGACVDAGRSHRVFEAVVAHVAFAHHATLRVILRHAIGAVPGAVLATDASIRAVKYDAGFRVFGVRFHGTADETRRLDAVIAAHREVVTLGI